MPLRMHGPAAEVHSQMTGFVANKAVPAAWHACRMSPSSIALTAACELFLRYTTRTRELESADFVRVKHLLIQVRLPMCEPAPWYPWASWHAFLSVTCMYAAHLYFS